MSGISRYRGSWDGYIDWDYLNGILAEAYEQNGGQPLVFDFDRARRPDLKVRALDRTNDFGEDT